MVNKILYGKPVADEIYSSIKNELSRTILTRKPRLDVIIVGNRPDSELYVKLKKKKAEELGFICNVIRFNNNVFQEDIIIRIDGINNDKKVDGILIQLPLPEHLDTSYIINRVKPSKDVDGFHRINYGCLLTDKNYKFGQVNNYYYIPCTAVGVMELLRYYNIELESKDVVMVGCSNVVGMPLALLLNQAGATVQICHILTKDVVTKCKNSDIIISCVGKPGLISINNCKDGQVLIDVGISEVLKDNGKKGIVGDMDYPLIISNYDNISITPVPRGVGSITIAVLLRHLLSSYINRKQ